MRLHRHGNFSSSEVYKLVKSGRGKDAYFSQEGLTYIQDKKYEARLKRSLNNESNSKPTNWGTFVEEVAFDRMGLEYSLVSKKRYSHHTINNWVGMPDVLSDQKLKDIVGDIKCPFTLKSFCKLVDAMNQDSPAEALKNQNGAKDDGYKYYWQLVSNGILCDKNYASLFVYVPYKKDLDMIRERANEYPDQNKVAFIQFAKYSELPYLVDDCEDYKDFNSCVFEIPKEDKEFLTERIIKATELLNE